MRIDPQPNRPRFTGVSLYNHTQGCLSFWYPRGWTLQEFPSAQITVSLLPDPTDPTTNVTIEVKDLHEPLAPDERNLISDGIRAGLSQLQECQLESWSELGKRESTDAWGIEWICTFVDGGQRRRRRARLFASSHYLYSVICQGTTPEDYAYWQGMFEFVLLTVGINPFSVTDWLKEQNPEIVM